MLAVVHGVMTMAEAEPEAAQPKVKVLRRTSISPKYIKADAELQHAATQYLTAIAEFSDKLKQVDEASRGGPALRDRMAVWLRWILGSITPPISPCLPA